MLISEKIYVEILFFYEEKSMYQGVNTRLEKQMILLILVTMKIKVIVESERKYSFQREISFLFNLL